MARSNSRPRRITLPQDRLTIGLLFAFIALAMITGVVAFIVLRNVVASWTMTQLTGDPVVAATNPPSNSGSSDPSVTATPPTGPLQVESGPAAQPWDGVSRVNILVMGLDYADTVERKIPRTDTMILFTLDPLSKTAGMLSIPRDLWVNIPDFDYGKINTAFFLGESFKMPGGGPGQAMRTVEQFLGVPINYYAQIDFDAFVEFIDILGGVEIDVPEKIGVDPRGPDTPLTKLYPGKHVLDGEMALAYARMRYTTNGDFDRGKRQMQVIRATRDKIINLNMLPTLISKAPQLYSQLSMGIHTNLTLQQAIQLALLVQQVPSDSIHQEVIGPQDATNGTSPDGLDILKPIMDKIRIKRDAIFTTGGPVGPAAISNSNPEDLMKAESAKISIQNATLTEGLAGRTSDFLKSKGMNIVDQSNAQLSSYTKIIIYSGKPYTLSYLAKLMNVPSAHIYNRVTADNPPADIVIVVGDDWAKSNPMP